MPVLRVESGGPNRHPHPGRQMTFVGIVRSCRGFGPCSELGAVVLDVKPGVVVPAAACFREVGHLTRADGLVIERAVLCLDARQVCFDVTWRFRDLVVTVGLDAMGMPTFKPIEV